MRHIHIGDDGWVRTTDQLINSQPLYHWATPSISQRYWLRNPKFSRNLHFTLVPDEACGLLTWSEDLKSFSAVDSRQMFRSYWMYGIIHVVASHNLLHLKVFTTTLRPLNRLVLPNYNLVSLTASVDFTVWLKENSGLNVVCWLTTPAGLRRRFNPD